MAKSLSFIFVTPIRCLQVGGLVGGAYALSHSSYMDRRGPVRGSRNRDMHLKCPEMGNDSGELLLICHLG